METATLEREVETFEAEKAVKERYSSYKVVPLFTRGNTEYFRCTRWGNNADGSAAILRSCFVEVSGGKITERKD
jgi:hypothetical protein